MNFAIARVVPMEKCAGSVAGSDRVPEPVALWLVVWGSFRSPAQSSRLAGGACESLCGLRAPCWGYQRREEGLEALRLLLLPRCGWFRISSLLPPCLNDSTSTLGVNKNNLPLLFFYWPRDCNSKIHATCVGNKSTAPVFFFLTLRGVVAQWVHGQRNRGGSGHDT